MHLFDDAISNEFMEWKNANPTTFNWWSYLNLKADLPMALGFAKLYYPEIVEVDGCFLLRDLFSEERYEGWKEECNGDKTGIEKMMNLYWLYDFFHRNTKDDGCIDEQLIAFGNVLSLFWNMSFKERFPDKRIVVKVFAEADGAMCITVFQERK